MRRHSSIFLLGLAALVIPACGGEDPRDFRLAVHPAAGKVLHRGRPVAGALVRFHPTDPSIVKLPEGKEGPSVVLTTNTDDQGQFAMTTYVADDGVPAGDYKVTVAPAVVEADVEHADDAKGKAAKPVPPALRRYQIPRRPR